MYSLLKRLCRRLSRRYEVVGRRGEQSQWRVYGKFKTYFSAQLEYWALVEEFWQDMDLKLVVSRGRHSGVDTLRSHLAGVPARLDDL